jgi:tetratricopeptide (TPR) repeat protein
MEVARDGISRPEGGQMLARERGLIHGGVRNVPTHWNNLGFAYRQSKQLPLAFRHYERALAIDPDHRGAHEYIGEAYLMVNNLARAEEHRARLEKLCFFPCEQLTDLRAKIAAYRKNAR